MFISTITSPPPTNHYFHYCLPHCCCNEHHHPSIFPCFKNPGMNNSSTLLTSKTEGTVGRSSICPQGNVQPLHYSQAFFWVFCLGTRKKSLNFPSEEAYNKCMTERISGESCRNSGNFWAASSTFHQSKSVFVILLCDIILESPTLRSLILNLFTMCLRNDTDMVQRAITATVSDQGEALCSIRKKERIKYAAGARSPSLAL